MCNTTIYTKLYYVFTIKMNVHLGDHNIYHSKWKLSWVHGTLFEIMPDTGKKTDMVEDKLNTMVTTVTISIYQYYYRMCMNTYILKIYIYTYKHIF